MKKKTLLGCLIAVMFMLQATLASAVLLDIEATAMSGDATFNITPNASLGGFTTFGVAATYDGTSWSSTTDFQTNNVAAAFTDPYIWPRAAADLVGPLEAVVSTASVYNDGTLTATSAAYSKTYSYQFFKVLSNAPVTANYDFNAIFKTDQDPTGPAVYGYASFAFALGKVTFDQNWVAHFNLSSSNPLAVTQGTFDGLNDINPGALVPDTLTYSNFSVGDIGFFFAETTAFASTDANLRQPVFPDPNPIPEPGTFLLLSAGMIGLLSYRRFRSSAA